ncbi:hypothetical protein [Tenacibaculum sp. UWU-22]|uniref:hypothetical protein n=1 Tax=Tenacibaculum sp. UWU-22 TaxID=3234187 RepID=UPI0034DB1C9A
MKKVFVSLLFFMFLSCGKEVIENNCFRGITLTETIYLKNAEFINLETPGRSATTNLGNRNIVIINTGSTPKYKAFDLQCPQKDCSSPMTINYPRLECPCSDKKYSMLSGCPINNNGNCIRDGSCFALEYNVIQTGNTLQISI